MYGQASNMKSSSLKIELKAHQQVVNPPTINDQQLQLLKNQQAQLTGQQAQAQMSQKPVQQPQQHQMTYAEAHAYKQLSNHMAAAANPFNLMPTGGTGFGAQTAQQSSPTHFFASLLQNPAVLQNPELMASVAGMLQSSLISPIQNQANVGIYQPMTNGFRNFSIPHSDSSGQPRSILNSSVCGSDHHSSSRSQSSYSSKDRKGSAYSTTSSDNESHDTVDIGKFKNNTELVVNKVMTVVEDILCNENIKKNNFLAKLFEEGTGSTQPQIYIKRLAGFKRIKAITTEFKIVQAAIKSSKMFSLSEDGLSAFRSMPLPLLQLAPKLDGTAFDNVTTSGGHTGQGHAAATGYKSATEKDVRVVKKILAINFDEEEFTIEKMTQIFEKIGEIAQIILVRPNRKMPDFLCEYAQWVPDLGTKPCVVIDFETQEAAQNACREINMSNRNGNAIRCALLKPGARIKRTLYRKYTSGEQNRESNPSGASSTTQVQKTSSENTSTTSHDSGINQPTMGPSKILQNNNFNKKNVKKAISKHFISLGAWKNSSAEAVSGNADESICPRFVRQPLGPTSSDAGFTENYRQSRVF